MKSLIHKVKNWATERNIHTTEPSKQFLKVAEEVGEMARALCRSDETLLADSIGDTLVTLIILCMQTNLDIEKCLGIAYEEIKDRKGKSVNGVFVKEDDIL